MFGVGPPRLRRLDWSGRGCSPVPTPRPALQGRLGGGSARGQVVLARAAPGGGAMRPRAGLSQAGGGQRVNTLGRWVLVVIAVGYLGLVVLLPFASIFLQALAGGLGPLVRAMCEPEFVQALRMTLIMAAIAVPINTVFGVLAALVLVRGNVRWKRLFIALLDIPFTISPIVTGLMFVLLYGRTGLFAPLLARFGFQVVFALPGMALATLFVTLPFVVRELIPVLEELDAAEEEAAASLGAGRWRVFWDVTLPNIRWGLLYGIILTNARAMGEFGAVSVVSGNIIGHTQTLTLFVESSYKEYNTGERGGGKESADGVSALCSDVGTMLAAAVRRRHATQARVLLDPPHTHPLAPRHAHAQRRRLRRRCCCPSSRCSPSFSRYGWRRRSRRRRPHTEGLTNISWTSNLARVPGTQRPTPCGCIPWPMPTLHCPPVLGSSISRRSSLHATRQRRHAPGASVVFTLLYSCQHAQRGHGVAGLSVLATSAAPVGRTFGTAPSPTVWNATRRQEAHDCISEQP